MRTKIIAGLLGLGMALPFSAGAWDVPAADIDVSAEFRAQWLRGTDGSDEGDRDLIVGLGADVPRVKWEGLSFSGFLRYEKDLDDTAESSAYKDTRDSYSNRDDFKLYRAALSYQLPNNWLSVTAGRQEIWSAETLTLDGGLVKVEPCRWAKMDLYAGRRVSFYSDPDTKAVYGGDLDLRPWRGGSVQLRDLYYLENSFEAAVMQQLWGLGFGRVAYRTTGSETRDASASLHLYPWSEAEVHLNYLRVFNDHEYDFTADEDDPVDALELPEQEPYADYGVTVRQGIFEVAGIGARLRRHNVIDDEDEDTYNVDFNEGSLMLDLSEWPWRGLRLDGEVTRWVEDRERDDLTEDSLWGYLLRAEQELFGNRIGVAYHRQTYDSDGAPRDSLGYDVWLHVRLVENTEVRLRYEHAEDDLYRQNGIDALNVFTARLEQAF